MLDSIRKVDFSQKKKKNDNIMVLSDISPNKLGFSSNFTYKIIRNPIFYYS